MPQASIVRINVNPQGGVPKHAIERTAITMQGVQGDHQRDQQHHGGLERAVSLYALECIHALQAEGHPIDIGSTGENLTVQGLDWARLQPGDQLAIGERVVLEITGYATPCKIIGASFLERNFNRIHQHKHPGWSRLYARVLHEGSVAVGDPIERI